MTGPEIVVRHAVVWLWSSLHCRLVNLESELPAVASPSSANQTALWHFSRGYQYQVFIQRPVRSFSAACRNIPKVSEINTINKRCRDVSFRSFQSKPRVGIRHREHEPCLKYKKTNKLKCSVCCSSCNFQFWQELAIKAKVGAAV